MENFNINKFKYFIIDKDGTILNSISIYTKNFVDLIYKKYKVPKEISKKFFLETSGNPLRVQYKNLLKKYNIKFDKEEFIKFKEEFHKNSLFLVKNNFFEGVKDVLKELKKKNKFILLSTGDRNYLTFLELREAGILNYFDIILCSDKIIKSEKHIFYFVKKLNINLSDFCKSACYIGDSFLDIEIAKKFNIFFIGVSTTNSKEILLEKGADLVLNNFSELLKFL